MDRNLIIPIVAIQVAEGVVSQPLLHFINEGRWKMIHPGGFVEFSIINAHSPASDVPLRNEFIFLILDDCHTTLLWHHFHWTYPLTVRNR
jgi:hypothetical protein